MTCKRAWRVFSVLVIIASLSSVADAADASFVKPGERVKIEHRKSRSFLYKVFVESLLGESSKSIYKGNLVRWDADSVVMVLGNHGTERKAVPASEVRKVHRSLGKRSAFWDGLLVGAGTGVLLAAGTYWIEGAGHPDDLPPPGTIQVKHTHPEYIAIPLAIGSVVVGGVIGHFTKVDRWERVEYDPKVGVDLTFEDDRIGLRLCYSF